MCVLHSSEPDGRQSRSGRSPNTIWTNPESQCTKILGVLNKNTLHWCNLKLAQRKGLQFFQNRSHAIALFNALPAIIEKVVYMKTGEALYCKVFQSPRLSRVVLTPNSQHGRQDPPNPDEKIHRPSVRTASVQGNLTLTSRGHVSIPEKVSDGCTGKPVAVTWITEFQEYLTPPCRKRIGIARTPSKD